MIASESNCGRQVFRTCRDYRHALSLVASAGSYPGVTVGGAVTPPLQAALDNFVRVWSARNFQHSRYSNGSWAVLYTANQSATTYVEVGYHLQELHLPSKAAGKDMEIPCLTYTLQISGKMHSYVHLTHDRSKLCETSPAGYSRCQQLAADARASNIPILEVFSARDLSGVCYPVLERRASSSPLATEEIIITITDSWKDVIVKEKRRTQTYSVER